MGLLPLRGPPKPQPYENTKRFVRRCRSLFSSVLLSGAQKGNFAHFAHKIAFCTVEVFARPAHVRAGKRFLSFSTGWGGLPTGRRGRLPQRESSRFATVGGGVPDAPRRGEGTPPYIQTAKGAATVSRGRDAAIFFALRTKKSPTVRSRERWGQNAISRPLKRRRAKRQNGGAACYWQEPHRRGKQPVDGSRLVMVSIR